MTGELEHLDNPRGVTPFKKVHYLWLFVAPFKKVHYLWLFVGRLRW